MRSNFFYLIPLQLSKVIVLIFLTASINAAYAQNTSDNELDTSPRISNKDPLEGFNRFMFKINEGLDNVIFKPVATVYNKIMPKPLNAGIHNVFLNINNVTTIANDILQLHFYQMTNDMWRLGVNTTLGIGGLFDVGNRIGLKPYTNDFGLTLAHYGWRDSTYLVLPLFGPNTIRDGVEIPVDYYLFSIYPYIEPVTTRRAIMGLGIIDNRAQLLKVESVMEEVAIDKYAFIRNAYLQRRAYQIQRNLNLNNVRVESVPPEPSTTNMLNIKSA